MKTSYRAVVIGGGVVGASVLYHLAKLGWSDVALIERAELTAGSTWHAAASFHALNSDPNIAALQDYTINLYKQIEAESGQSCGLHITGGINFATNPTRWDALQASWATFRAIGIESTRLMTTAEIADLAGDVMRTDDILGGLYDSNEGYLDPNGTTYAFAGAAKKYGADVILRNRVLELNQRADGTWNVVTQMGTIHTEHVVNAAGLWAKQCGLMAGVDLPVTPMEHHYLVTDTVQSLIGRQKEFPGATDLDGFTYSRQEGDGLLLGVYELNPKHWHMDGAPWDYGMDLIPEDVDRISDELSKGFERFPDLATTGIKRWVNGAFTFSPDGNPLVGPVGPRGYWVACGVMAGFSQGGGVGKSLAEWMINGAPEADIFGMDIARYGLHQSNKEYIRQTTGQFYARRFVMAYPNEHLPAGRPMRTTGSYRDMTLAGAVWEDNWGLETPLYFAPSPDFEEPGTLHRSAAFPIVAEECFATRDAAGLLDISGFSRYRISGKGAKTWLDRLLACRLPAPGKVKLAPMLAEDGRLRGDLTCLNWGDGSYWLMGSYYMRAFHMRWFHDHMGADVNIEDISDTFGGFSVSGPKSREILQRLCDTDLSNLKMMNCRKADFGLHRARISRLSLTGEMAFEINCAASDHAPLRKALLAAGADAGMREIGFEAVESMRLEKAIGIWNAEFTQAYTPAMTGLDRWIDWEKDGFIGAKAARSAAMPSHTLALLKVDTTNADALGFEPVCQKGKLVGITTSGGYGHRTGQSLALAMVEKQFAKAGTQLTVHVMGKERPAKVFDMLPYDPSGKRMRS